MHTLPVEYCPSRRMEGFASKSLSVRKGEKKWLNLKASSMGRTWKVDRRG